MNTRDEIWMHADIRTHADRVKWIGQLRRTAVTAAHIERLRLIYAPFPVVRRFGTGSAMPWAGTIVADTFFGDMDRPKGKHGDGRDGFYEGNGAGSTAYGDSYSGLYANALERELG